VRASDARPERGDCGEKHKRGNLQADHHAYQCRIAKIQPFDLIDKLLESVPGSGHYSK
jgi:hypothetical protein